MGLFGGKTEIISQEPLFTPGQKEALNLLKAFGETGRLGDFTAGQPADLSGFNFDISPSEELGSSLLLGLLKSKPQGIDTSRKALTDLATQEFNPDDPSNAFGAFRRQLARATKDAGDVINREAAITGSRFGSRIAGEKADLAAQQSDILATELGRLFDASQNRKLSASQGLGALAQTEDAINQSRIAQAFQLGGLERDLKNQEAQLKLNDFYRQRNERLNSIGSLNTVAGTQVPFGVKDLEFNTPSPFTSLLSTGLSATGTAIGGLIGNKISDLFKKKQAGGF